jgi:hypothetical protein
MFVQKTYITIYDKKDVNVHRFGVRGELLEREKK